MIGLLDIKKADGVMHKRQRAAQRRKPGKA